jgi:hypothetical protein
MLPCTQVREGGGGNFKSSWMFFFIDKKNTVCNALFSFTIPQDKSFKAQENRE